jgi:ABC-type polysaccharide/polyol phosphate export permease
VTVPTYTLSAFTLLSKGCLRREVARSPIRALWKHILLPVAIVAFVAMLETGSAARNRWPPLAVAGAVWLLFANSVNQGGMMLWHERWLLRQAVVPPALLLTAATLVPLGLFVVHLSLIHLALFAAGLPRTGVAIDIALGGAIAAALGVGAGIFAARVTEVRPAFTAMLPTLILASLVVTPVFYPLSALDGLKSAWCVVNPLCAATELGRAGVLFQAEPLPPSAVVLACVSSGAILGWALLTLRARSLAWAGEHV